MRDWSIIWLFFIAVFVWGMLFGVYYAPEIGFKLWEWGLMKNPPIRLKIPIIPIGPGGPC